ncbi:MAG: hypothetical protein HXS48_22095 [Theionarchaea archaeon]|nr:hypothetical protein [Theionarchaea archaeon]
MKIEIDYNLSGSDNFWVSVPLNEEEVISFAHAKTGSRIMNQVLIEKKPIPAAANIDGEWDVLVFDDGKFTENQHVRWINLKKENTLQQ